MATFSEYILMIKQVRFSLFIILSLLLCSCTTFTDRVPAASTISNFQSCSESFRRFIDSASYKDGIDVNINGKMTNAYNIKRVRHAFIGNVDFEGREFFIKISAQKKDNYLIKSEYEGTKLLYENGISTPVIKFFDEESGVLVRDYFKGEEYKSIDDPKDLTIATIKLYEMIKKMNEHNIEVFDLHAGNVLYNKSTQDMVIIDVHSVPGWVPVDNLFNILTGHLNSGVSNTPRILELVDKDKQEALLGFFISEVQKNSKFELYSAGYELSETQERDAINYINRLHDQDKVLEEIKIKVAKIVGESANERVKISEIITEVLRSRLMQPSDMLNEWIDSHATKHQIKKYLYELLKKEKLEAFIEYYIGSHTVPFFPMDLDTPINSSIWRVLLEISSSNKEIFEIFLTSLKSYNINITQSHIDDLSSLPVEVREIYTKALTK